MTRILDATLTACWRHASRPLERDDVDALTSRLPLRVAGIEASVPLVAPDAYGDAALRQAAAYARWVEPLDAAALETVDLLPQRPGTPRVVVHPEPLRAMEGPTEVPDKQQVWEHRLVLEATETSVSRRLPDLLERALAHVPSPHRIRLEDPHGTLDLTTAAALATHPGAGRLTVAPSNARGLATAIAHVLLQANGPHVVTTLLGRAPRGAPATEHLVPHDRIDDLRPAAEAVALATGRGIEPEHSHWGGAGTTSDGAPRRVDPARLVADVTHQLHVWGLELDPPDHERLIRTLRGRLRPGDRLDGPTLWATLATVTDLRRHAADTPDRPA